MQRRDFLSSAIALAAASTLPVARAEEISGGQPWQPGTASLPALPTVRQGGLAFFNQHEFQTANSACGERGYCMGVDTHHRRQENQDRRIAPAIGVRVAANFL